MSSASSPKKSLFGKLFSKTRKNRMGEIRSIYNQALAYYQDILNIPVDSMEDAVHSEALSVKQLEEDYAEFIKPVFKGLIEKGYNTESDEYKALFNAKYDATNKVKAAEKRVRAQKQKVLDKESKGRTKKIVNSLQARLNGLRGGGRGSGNRDRRRATRRRRTAA